MKEIRSDVEKLVKKELDSANQRFPMFRSDHEGYAVIKEEYEEAECELAYIKDRVAGLWNSVKHDLSAEWITEINATIMNRSVNLACEAIQVAAMAQKFINSQKEREKSEDN